MVTAEQDVLVAKTEIVEESDTEFVELLEFLGQLSTENGNWLEEGIMAEVLDGNDENQTGPLDKPDEALRKEPAERPGF